MKVNLSERGLEGAALVAAIIGIIIGFLGISFLLFTFGYWLITLILLTFFNFVLPFSWWYSLGAWLIALVLGLFTNFKVDFDS